jgi:hypothetical protein
MIATRTSPVKSRVSEAADVVSTHPGLTIAALAVLAAGIALFVTMEPELRRYLRVRRM